jgi:DNA-binding LacI/PurR family transcriptional regulator
LNNCLSEPFSCISIDNKHAAKEATEYLISLGHRKIATITGNLKTHAGSERLAGFKEALKEHKINLPDNYIKNGDFMRSISRNSAEELLSLKEKPSAIFAASDVMAMEMIDAARQKNLEVPKDISVFGFDDFPMNIYSPIHLSTVSQPLEEMGRLGVEALNQIISKKVSVPFKKILKAKLIKRESCAKIV